MQEYQRTGKPKQSAILAGYSPTSAHVAAYKLLRDKVLLKYMAIGGEVGLATLVDVAQNSKVDIARVAASKELVERAYGKARMNTEDSKRIPNISITFNKVAPEVEPAIKGEPIDVDATPPPLLR